METINITFNGGRGRMTIRLGEFFPTGTARVRKLLKIIREDWEHGDELRTDIVQHCEQCVTALKASLKDYANEAVNLHTKATEMQPDIDRMEQRIKIEQHYLDTRRIDKATAKMYRDQLKAEKKHLSEKKKLQQDYLAGSRKSEQRFKRAQRDIELLEKNAEVVRDEQ